MRRGESAHRKCCVSSGDSSVGEQRARGVSAVHGALTQRHRQSVLGALSRSQGGSAT